MAEFRIEHVEDGRGRRLWGVYHGDGLYRRRAAGPFSTKAEAVSAMRHVKQLDGPQWERLRLRATPPRRNPISDYHLFMSAKLRAAPPTMAGKRDAMKRANAEWRRLHGRRR